MEAHQPNFLLTDCWKIWPNIIWIWFKFYVCFYVGSNSWVAKTNCFTISDFKEKGRVSVVRRFNGVLVWVLSEFWQGESNDAPTLVDCLPREVLCGVVEAWHNFFFGIFFLKGVSTVCQPSNLVPSIFVLCKHSAAQFCPLYLIACSFF